MESEENIDRKLEEHLKNLSTGEKKRLLVKLVGGGDNSGAQAAARVSHEIRTPLNGIMGMVEMLLKQDLSVEAKDLVFTLKEASDGLLLVCNDILDYAKLEAGKLELQVSHFDPVAIVDSVAQILAPQAAGNSILLATTYDNNVPALVSGDANRLRQVLLNLAGNAIKYTEMGHVVISIQCGGRDQLRFAVTDSGRGMSKASLQNIFLPFFQERDVKACGTGLGLTITKTLVSLMGGTVEVESEQFVGSTFSFELPLPFIQAREPWRIENSALTITLETLSNGCPVLATILNSTGIKAQSTQTPQETINLLTEERTASDKRILVLDSTRYPQDTETMLKILADLKPPRTTILEITPSFDNVIATYVGGAKLIPLPLPIRKQDLLLTLSRILHINRSEKKTVSMTDTARLDRLHPSLLNTAPRLHPTALVAEDNKINQQVAFLFLKDLGFEVDLASDGVEAVQRCKCKKYDLIFLDGQMPRLGGTAAAEIIKEILRRRGINTPVIAVTADAILGSRERYLASGMDDYLPKPINPEALKALVQKWLGQGRQYGTVKTGLPENAQLGTRKGVINLDKLSSACGPRDKEKILCAFQENYREEYNKISDLFHANKYGELLASIKSFRSACEILGADKLMANCNRLEDAVQAGYVSTAGLTLDEMKRLLEQVDREILQTLADRNTFKLTPVRHSDLKI